MTVMANEAEPRALVWAFASVASVAIHTALVALILTIARMAPASAPETQISIATLEGSALTASPIPSSTVAPAATDAKAVRMQAAPAERLAAAETAKPTASSAEPDRVAPVAGRQAAEKAPEADAALVTKPEPVEAATDISVAAPADTADVARAAPDAPLSEVAVTSDVAAVAEPPDLADRAAPVETAAPVGQPAPAVAVARAEPTAPVERVAPPEAPAASRPRAAAVRAEPPAAASIERSAPAAVARAESPAAAERIAPAPTIPVTDEPKSRAAEPQRIAPIAPLASEPKEEVASLPPARAGPTPAELRRAGITRFLTSYRGGNCFLAVPAGAEKDLHLRVFADQTTAFSLFQNQAAGAIDTYAEPAPVGSAQCLALSFARSLPRYPDFGLGIELESPDVVSGASLVGRVFNATASSVYLLLVDDEGMVQRADRFFTPLAPGARRFSVPMVLTDTPATPTQLLIAISADQPVPQLEALTRAPATDIFGQLTRDADRATMDFAIVAFVVRRL